MHRKKQQILGDKSDRNRATATATAATTATTATATMESTPLLQDKDQQQNGQNLLHHNRTKNLLLILPLCILFGFGFAGQLTVTAQLIYYRIGIDENVTPNATRAFICAPNGSADAAQSNATHQLQESAAQFNLYRGLLSNGLALITAPVYAGISDKIGRQVAIIVPIVGTLLDSGTNLLVAQFNFPLWVILIGSGISGLTGTFIGIIAAILAYVADISTSASRAITLAVAEATFGITIAGVEMLMGYWIKWQGYGVPSACCTGMIAVALLHCLLFIKDTTDRSGNASSGGVRHWLDGLHQIVRHEHRSMILSSMAAFCSVSLVTIGEAQFLLLFAMNFPFCLSSVGIGYYVTIKLTLYQIGTLVTIRFLLKRLGYSLLSVISCCSAILCFSLTAFVQNVTQLFAVPVFGILIAVLQPLIRASLSQVVGPQLHGSVFGLLAIMQAVANLTASAGFAAIYKATEAWMPGFAYLIMAACSSVTLCCVTATAILKRMKETPAVIVVDEAF